MQTRTITNLVLGIALLALAIFIYTEVQRGANPDRQTLTALKPADVTDLKINNVRNTDIVLHKQDDHWQLVKPFAAPANSARIEKLLGIVSATSQAKYPVGDVDLSELRLVKPDIRVWVNNIELMIGTTEPIDQRRYIKVGDNVHLITDSYSFLAQGEATDFVDSQLLPGNPGLQSLTLPGLSLHQDDKGWQVDNVASQPGADRIQQFLDEWRDARALKVTHVDPAGLSSDVHITLSGNAGDINYHLQRDDNEIVLTRLDTGLAYHLHHSSGERLLKLPEPPPAKKADASKPPE